MELWPSWWPACCPGSKLGEVVHKCNPRTWEVEAKGSEVLKVNLGCLKQINRKGEKDTMDEKNLRMPVSGIVLGPEGTMGRGSSQI